MCVLILILHHRMTNPPLRIGAPSRWSSCRFAFWISQSVWPKRTSSRESNVKQSGVGRPQMAGRSSVVISPNIYLRFRPIVMIWCHWLEEKSWFQRAKNVHLGINRRWQSCFLHPAWKNWSIWPIYNLFKNLPALSWGMMYSFGIRHRKYQRSLWPC